ncbi:MAG: hypothetical protein KDD14_22310 [Saprospiraceae bacterium]|nr:hypothetical protein [Saprospiraceae bacterium]
MKKKVDVVFLQKKRERKKNKRKLKKKNRRSRNREYLYSVQKKIIQSLRIKNTSKLWSYCNNYFYDPNLITYKLEVPSHFSLETNNFESIKFIKSLFTTLKHCSEYNNELVEISFEKCKTLRLGPLMVVNVIISDFFKWKSNIIKKGVPEHLLPNITLNPIMDDHINNLLFTMHFPVKIKKADQVPVFGFRLIQGKVKASSFSDISKGKISKGLRQYINSCLRVYEVELNEEGESLFDNMIGEILANADDHSSIDTWYANGSFSISNSNEDDSEAMHLGELNLIFLNFGESIYQGIEASSHLNSKMTSEMNALYEQTINTQTLRERFSKETMTTLYALQEGYSRLLYEDQSRGAGTMTFIRAFLDLGYDSLEQVSTLYILSGKSLIKCTPDLKPFLIENRYYLSLNSQKDMTHPPSETNALTLDEYFPGTLLVTSIFLNKEHLKSMANE